MKSPIITRQEPVVVRTYDTTVDEYGQMHTSYTERPSSMYVTKYVQTPNSDVRYNDIVMLGLTHDFLTNSDNVIYNGAEYKVRYTIESIRWNQVFMALSENG